MFSDYVNKIYSFLSSVKFDTLMWLIIGSFAGIFLLALLLTLFSRKFKASDKRPFLCLANAFSALVFAAFLTGEELAQSCLAAVIFWFAGYLAYGVLCFFTSPVKEKPAAVQTVLSAMPVRQQPATEVRTDVPAAKSSVRLEHAISVTDRLLQKNLGKSDRQELEKLKGTLSVLQIKGTLTPAESDILNENFNALLKLMAKYNV